MDFKKIKDYVYTPQHLTLVVVMDWRDLDAVGSNRGRADAQLFSMTSLIGSAIRVPAT